MITSEIPMRQQTVSFSCAQFFEVIFCCLISITFRLLFLENPMRLQIFVQFWAIFGFPPNNEFTEKYNFKILSRIVLLKVYHCLSIPPQASQISLEIRGSMGVLFYYYHDFNIIIIIVNIFMKSFILRRCLGIEFGLWLPFRRIFGLGLAEVRRLGRKSGLKSDEIYPILAPTLFVTTPRAIYDSRGFSGLFLRFPLNWWASSVG